MIFSRDAGSYLAGSCSTVSCKADSCITSSAISRVSIPSSLIPRQRSCRKGSRAKSCRRGGKERARPRAKTARARGEDRIRERNSRKRGSQARKECGDPRSACRKTKTRQAEDGKTAGSCRQTQAVDGVYQPRSSRRTATSAEAGRAQTAASRAGNETAAATSAGRQTDPGHARRAGTGSRQYGRVRQR